VFAFLGVCGGVWRPAIFHHFHKNRLDFLVSHQNFLLLSGLGENKRNEFCFEKRPFFHPVRNCSVTREVKYGSPRDGTVPFRMKKNRFQR
jgi:hypothetical protein